MADAEPKKKIIIDTDPGIDDAMAIFVALRSPEVEVIGLTTIFGNVYTTLATRNALHLLEVAGRTDIPVAEGSHVTFTKGTKLRIADFVHGTDGLGNQNFPPPKAKPIEQSAAAFLVQQANLYPGEVTVVALGPLTNIALAMELDPAFSRNIGQIVILGGAFAVNGNVNPAAEANVSFSKFECMSTKSANTDLNKTKKRRSHSGIKCVEDAYKLPKVFITAHLISVISTLLFLIELFKFI